MFEQSTSQVLAGAAPDVAEDPEGNLTADTESLEEIKRRLHTQVAVYARDFGALLGMSPAKTTEAISKKRLGVPTFQAVENGIHRVSSQVVLEFFAARGIEL